MPVKSKKTARQKAIKRADDAMSEYIRARDKECVICGSRERLTNGHLITRGKYSVRWKELNCHCQCRGCNLLHEHQPEQYTSWFIQRYGLAAYEELVRESNTIKKYKTHDIEEIARYYKKKLEEL
jgi:hypothetical protein